MRDAPSGQPMTKPADQAKADDAAIIRRLAAKTRAGFRTVHPVPFGAQINRTRTGAPVVLALNQVVRTCDPTAHAEVRAIRLACRKLGRANLAGCTLYTTCEPCPMCLTAALMAGLDRVVYGTVVRRPDAKGPPLFDYSAKKFAARSQFRCQVTGPVEEALCRALVDDPVVREYVARHGRKGVFI
jgi:tRNA(adenine34) deaminase